MDMIEAVEVLETEMEKHGLLDDGWTYGFDIPRGEGRDYRTLGTCSSSEKTIYISAHHAREAHVSAVLETIRHEIAHALVGDWHGHDEVWQACARRIGALAVAIVPSIQGAVIHLGCEERHD